MKKIQKSKREISIRNKENLSTDSKNTTSGITLIALVITIIVLLILTGVTIATLTGENGILTQVGNAKEENQRSQAEEEVKLALGNLQIEESQSAISQDDKREILEEDLKQFYPKQQPESTVEIEGAGFLINHRGYQFEVDENYTVLFIEHFDAEEWDKNAADEDCFIWGSNIPGEEGYGIVIGYNANITNYTTLRFPSRCTNIVIDTSYISGSEERTFTKNIKEVELPRTVTEIERNAFSEYNFTQMTKINIPRSVTSIGDSAFYNCTSLSSITIPSSVTSIGNNTFYNCTSLSSVTMPSSVTSIGDYTFNYCRSLSNITIPKSVISIGSCAFEGCTSLSGVTIPSSVTIIGNSAFADCTSLSNITISSNVTNIGDSAFSSCSKLTNIDVSANNQNYSNKDGVLFNKDKTKLIQYPAGKQDTVYIIPSSVISIEATAFSGCTSLSSVTIPSSVTSIGNGAFANCTSLSDIKIPSSVTNIGYTVFSYCRSLSNITIPSSVINMRSYVFQGWTSSQTINIQEYTSKPSGWYSDWRYNCYAKVVWGQ
ncbi:MAG: leucine-rich repeat domain-containing protein [Clostridia bacterium]